MGVYGSKAVTDTNSIDESNNKIDVGVSSMQGWRLSQEDAHVSIIDFDKNASLFGVFDGHGGEEVAQFTAKTIGDVLKKLDSYKDKEFKKSLEETFLQIDELILTPKGISDMRALVGDVSEDSEDERNEAALLREEADLPIEELLTRYSEKLIKKSLNNLPKDKTQSSPSSSIIKNQNKLDIDCASSSSSSSSISLSCSSSSTKILSKPSSSSPSSITMIESSSSMTIEMVNNDVEEPSCSTQSSSNGEINRLDDEVKDDCESVSSSGEIETINKKLDDDTVSSSKVEEIVEDTNCLSNEASETTPSSSTNLNSTKADSKVNSITNGDCDQGVSTSSDKKDIENGVNKNDENGPTSSLKIDDETNNDEQCSKKGKGKKVISKSELQQKERPKREVISKPIYEAFLNDMEVSDSEDSDDSEDLEDNSDAEDEEESDEEEGDDDQNEEEEEDKLDEETQMFPVFTKDNMGMNSGCTAVVALLHDNDLYVANAGDSRCVLCRDGVAVDLSEDHKPEDKIELSRILNAGGKVFGGRVNGGLNLSRAIGDHSYKTNKDLGPKEQMITAFPDVKHVQIDKNVDKFIVLACDGIWNSMTSEEVVDFVNERIDKETKLSKICEELFFHCLAGDSSGDGEGCDNMTAIIIRLKDFVKKEKRQMENEDENEPNSKRIKT